MKYNSTNETIISKINCTCDHSLTELNYKAKKTKRMLLTYLVRNLDGSSSCTGRALL